MQFRSTKGSLLLLGVTALACSRTLFFLFHDPEGPNLLIVTVLAVILYILHGVEILPRDDREQEAVIRDLHATSHRRRPLHYCLKSSFSDEITSCGQSY
jgi:hypothetical protein